MLNLEYDKWDEGGVTPEHDVTVPLTRMLAGPLDYHQGTLRGVPLERFKPRVAEPLVIGTPSRMLASYVVLQNHLPMMADYPSAYRRHPLTRVMSAVPATWDDTRALAARVGEEVVIARRSGNDWWIGAMTDRHAREVRVPLSFLPPGMFQAEIYQDDLAAEHGFKRETREVTPPDELSLRLAAAGGALVRLTPVPEPPPKWRLVWSDDFDTLDPDKWELIESSQPTNDSLQDYLPEQISVKDGKLEILSENKPSRGLPYRSGQVVSRLAQRLGRWEVRAKLPGTTGMWPAIRLLPDAPWPTGGEIDIMENRGNQPTITSSAFHWGTRNPDSHDIFRGRAADGDRRRARVVRRRFSHVRLRVGREPAAVLRRRHAPRDVLQRRGGLLPAETLRADAADDQHGDRRRLPASPGRDDRLAAAVSRRLGPRLRARRGTGRSDVPQRRFRRKRRLAGRLARLRQSSSTANRMCSCIERRCAMARTH